MFFNRSKNTLILSAAFVFTLISTLACSLFVPATPQPAATLNSLYTAAAQTLSVMSTQGAASQPTASSATPTLSIATNSLTPLATYTPAPPLTTVTKCDAAAFITDLTYPDGSLLGRGNTFTKTWRIKNVGTCTWTTSYNLVFVGGEGFGGKSVVALPASVGPGGSVDVSVQLKTPNQNGRYQGYWKLSNASGVLFGFGPQADSSIYVDVNVSGYTVTGYDLAANLCDASWRNDDKSLPCPGNNGSSDGFAVVVAAPEMEDGKVRGVGLLTHPQMVKDGMIAGKYSPVSIQSGDHFNALIGCLNKANDCDMIFKLDYQIGSDPVKSLGQWHEIYEGNYYPINIDLSFLSDKKVKFILTVLANGSSHEDYGLWVNPRITRQSAQPPTKTPTATLSPTVTNTPTQTYTPTVTFTPTATQTPVTASPTVGP
jgi:hypothetical protein